METVILKKSKISKKFNVIYPSGVPLNYSADLKSVEHPEYKNVWIVVSEKEILRFNNGDLDFELEKIKGFDSPITVSKEYDKNLDYPYSIDVEDSSYFYANKKERDSDYELLKIYTKNLTFFSK